MKRILACILALAMLLAASALACFPARARKRSACTLAAYTAGIVEENER